MYDYCTRSDFGGVTRHHIATDHGPMVQGGLLTAHPGSVQGDGEAPGGESSLRQCAGTRSPGSLDLEKVIFYIFFPGSYWALYVIGKPEIQKQ